MAPKKKKKRSQSYDKINNLLLWLFKCAVPMHFYVFILVEIGLYCGYSQLPIIQTSTQQRSFELRTHSMKQSVICFCATIV